MPGGVENPTVTVQLVLGSSSVPDADRCASGIAGPVFQQALTGCGAAVEGEEGRKPGTVETAGVEQPGEKAKRFELFPGGEESGDADGSVTGPGVPVVPIANAADPLR